MRCKITYDESLFISLLILGIITLSFRILNVLNIEDWQFEQQFLCLAISSLIISSISLSLDFRYDLYFPIILPQINDPFLS